MKKLRYIYLKIQNIYIYIDKKIILTMCWKKAKAHEDGQ